ncbi:Major Facilitator Superfamily transporter [Spirochaeta africana DSM 8902]|uniref:Major Facilitator Superfamily transporter n=2 Tax=Spirochaeta TaxID=146 RepID=H9UHM4_SPIAZ|nr:Major Facilitator Superfamily transporter [Spirochaeta africana DSM 8902]
MHHGRALPRGWIFIMGLIGSLMTLPGQTNGVSAFTDHLIEAVQITRDQLSLAYLLGTLTSAFLLPHAGKLYDRWGSRVTGAASAAGLGISLFGLVSLPQVISGAGQLGLPPIAAALISFWLGFFLIRFFGQGMLTLISRNMILKWFDDRRGFAIALLGIGMPLGFSAAPSVLNALIGSVGWQGAWLVLGAILLGFALVAAATYADPPLESGHDATAATRTYAPNTAPIPLLLRPIARLLNRYGLRRTREPMRPVRDRTLSEARRSLGFWVFNGVTTLSGMLVTGFTFHVVAIMGQSGVGRTQALAIFIPTAIIQIAVQTVGSFGSDFVKLKYFAIAHAASLGLMLLSLELLSVTGAAYWLVVLFQGISLGLFGINSAVVWPRFFGLRHLGAISGFSNAWMVAGSALGPYAFSLAERLTGSFYTILYVMGPVALLLTVLGFRAESPARADAGL